MTDVVEMCAQKLREQTSEARRLFHGRGHSFPGFEHLVVNWLPPYLHIACYRAPETFDVSKFVDELVDAIIPITTIQGVVVQTRQGRATTSEVVMGCVPEEVLVSEAGLNFWVQPTRNQNTGLFLDMGHVREWLAPLVDGARVLNLFAYTCAFSVSAIANGAALVVNNDMSKNALEWGERNHKANDHDLRKVRMIPHNLFKSWWKVKQFGPYDVVIIDPPTNQRGSFVAEKSYGQVLKRIPEFTTAGGLVLACLNSPFLGDDFIAREMQRHASACEVDHIFDLHPDFPDQFPERGLKVVAYRYKP